MTCLCRHEGGGGAELQLQFIGSSALGGGGRSTPRSGHFIPGKIPVPVVHEAGWVSGPVWPRRKIAPPPGFDPRNVHPVASRCTDCAFSTVNKIRIHIFFWGGGEKPLEGPSYSEVMF